MDYLLFICGDGVPTPEKTEAMHEHVPNWVDEMDGRGIRQFGYALAPPSSAQTVRVRDGATIVSDGPFAESKEFVAGFDVIECTDLDEAIEVAAKHPVSWFNTIEIRPFADFPLGSSGTGSEGQALFRDLPAPPESGHRYLLLMCINGIAESDEEEAGIRRDAADWLSRAIASGAHTYGQALKPAETATTVQVRNGQTLVSDGPFVETKEFIGGVDIVDCASQGEAVALAAQHPIARYHMIEIRQFDEEV